MIVKDAFLKYKNESYIQRLKKLAFSGSKNSWNFCIFGGTGAVGGQTVIELLNFFDVLYRIKELWASPTPSLIVTGMSLTDIETFIDKLKIVCGPKNLIIETFIENDAYNPVRKIVRRKDKVEIEFYMFDARPIDFDKDTSEFEGSPGGLISQKLLRRVQEMETKFIKFLEKVKKDRGIEKFRSVICGIPIPSVAAYKLDIIDEAFKKGNIGEEEVFKYTLEVKEKAFEKYAEEFGRIKQYYADEVIIAHTTSVGGMYTVEDKKVVIRLGYAHRAVDAGLLQKQYFAEVLTEMYSKHGLKILITAAAIGIDNIFIDQPLRIHPRIKEHYQAEADKNLLPFNIDLLKNENKKDDPRTPEHINKIFCSDYLVSEGHDTPRLRGRLCFEKNDTPLKPINTKFALRSGENGIFSIDNAYALYLNMKISTQEELAHIIAYASMFGDDDQKRWFDPHNGISYQTETDNSSLVFSFLNNRAEFREYQLSGFTPKAFQDLGSAKHQGELHTIGLYILRHRLKALDPKMIKEKITSLYSLKDVIEFVDKNTEPLKIEHIIDYNIINIGQQFAQMLTLSNAQDMAKFTGFNGSIKTSPFIEQFFIDLLQAVNDTINTITSLGSPIIFKDTNEDNRSGVTKIKIGPYCSPLEKVITTGNTLSELIETGKSIDESEERYLQWVIANNGFIDLRPSATLVTTKDPIDLKKNLFSFEEEDQFREKIEEIQQHYYSQQEHMYFTSSGITAFVGRMRGLHEQLSQFNLSLGTLNNWRSLFPVDSNMSHLVIPGIIEAMRMYSEGLGKITGSEHLYPQFGYYVPFDREDRF